MEKICVRCRVSGHVQGVWYRSTTKDVASELGLTGWVRNLPDGNVEVLACGEKANVDALVEWLWKGPPAAKVTHVESGPVAWEEHQNFVVR